MRVDKYFCSVQAICIRVLLGKKKKIKMAPKP